MVWDLPIQHLLRARAAFRGGQWDEAEAEAQAGISLSRDAGGSIAEVWLLCVLARLAVARHDREQAGRLLAQADEAAAGSGQGLDQVTWAHGLQAEVEGDLDTAASYLNALWDQLVERGLDYYVWDVATDVLRVALRRGDQDRSAQVLEVVADTAARFPDSSAPVVEAQCRGLAHHDPDALVEAAERLSARKAEGRPVELALIQVDAAALLDHAGRVEEAEALRAAAQPALDRSGAVPPGVPGLGAAPRPARTGATFGWESLTDREQEVIALVGESLSNAEIADRLSCSRRTVESHLSHAYTKLGMSSRVELAVEASRRLAVGANP
jgi:DNA-binding CsgD family transcriptional regulator